MWCDYYDGPSIAWRDDLHRFEPFLCIDDNGLIVFYDNYKCPEYRCPIYYPVDMIITPLSEIFEDDGIDFKDSVRKLVDMLAVKGIDIADYKIVYWCYTGDRNCEEESVEMWQDKLRELAHYLNQGYEIVELREQDEGNSILLAVRADDIPRLENLMNRLAY